jgi:hypothetical protein
MSVVDVVVVSISFFSSHYVGPHLHRDAKRLRGGCKSRSVASVVVSDDTNNPNFFLWSFGFSLSFQPNTQKERERERASIAGRFPFNPTLLFGCLDEASHIKLISSMV